MNNDLEEKPVEEQIEKETEKSNRLKKAFNKLPIFGEDKKYGKTKPTKRPKERAKKSRHTDHKQIVRKRQKKNKKNKKK